MIIARYDSRWTIETAHQEASSSGEIGLGAAFAGGQSTASATMDCHMPRVQPGSAIERTIRRSVMAQELRDWELIVASDGSTDETDAVVQALAREDPRVRLIRTPRFGFPSGPCNAAVAEARSDLVAYVGHDDELRPEHLAVLTGAMATGVDVVYTRGATADASGRRLADTDPLQQYWHPELQLMSALFEPVRAGYRRAALVAAGGWRETAVGLEDWDLWLRMSDDERGFAPAAAVSVSMLRDPATLQHKLACDQRIELARFAEPAAARAAFRALTDRRRLPAFLDAYRRDAVTWYRGLWATGDVACPASWAGDESRMLAAVESSLHAQTDLWQTTRPASYADDRHVLESVAATQTAEHAARAGACFARAMPEFMAAVAVVVEQFDGAMTEWADTTVAGRTGRG